MGPGKIAGVIYAVAFFCCLSCSLFGAVVEIFAEDCSKGAFVVTVRISLAFGRMVELLLLLPQVELGLWHFLARRGLSRFLRRHQRMLANPMVRLNIRC